MERTEELHQIHSQLNFAKLKVKYSMSCDVRQHD